MGTENRRLKVLRATNPAQLERDLHVLEGIIVGVASDGVINAAEMRQLTNWCDDKSEAADRHPFSALIPMLMRSMEDGTIDVEERSDLLHFLSNARPESIYYDLVTSDMQTLHGVLMGISADGVVNERELGGLRKWLASSRHLRGSWPYDQAVDLVDSVLADGRIDQQEHVALLGFCRSFATGTANTATGIVFDEKFIRTGEVDASPKIVFEEKRFCITGESEVCKRSVIIGNIEAMGGVTQKSVTPSLDYLLICGKGSQAWAFASYGRKIEAAVDLRKRGEKIGIIAEEDFWDAVEKLGRKRPKG